MDPQRTLEVPATRLLAHSAERDVSFQIPGVLSHRLDALATLMERDERDAEGKAVKQRTTTRKELIAALIFTAPSQREDLERVLARYRDATVGSAAIPPRSKGRVKVPARSPGVRLTSDQESARSRGRTAPRRRRYTPLP